MANPYRPSIVANYAIPPGMTLLTEAEYAKYKTLEALLPTIQAKLPVKLMEPIFALDGSVVHTNAGQAIMEWGGHYVP